MDRSRFVEFLINARRTFNAPRRLTIAEFSEGHFSRLAANVTWLTTLRNTIQFIRFGT